MRCYQEDDPFNADKPDVSASSWALVWRCARLTPSVLCSQVKDAFGNVIKVSKKKKLAGKVRWALGDEAG